MDNDDDIGADSRGGRKGKRSRVNVQASNYSEATRPKRVDEFATTGTRPDYKDVDRLRRYVNAQGKILPRRRSGLSAKHQRMIAIAVKRARHLALLPMPGILASR